MKILNRDIDVFDITMRSQWYNENMDHEYKLGPFTLYHCDDEKTIYMYEEEYPDTVIKLNKESALYGEIKKLIDKFESRVRNCRLDDIISIHLKEGKLDSIIKTLFVEDESEIYLFYRPETYKRLFENTKSSTVIKSLLKGEDITKKFKLDDGRPIDPDGVLHLSSFNFNISTIMSSDNHNIIPKNKDYKKKIIDILKNIRVDKIVGYDTKEDYGVFRYGKHDYYIYTFPCKIGISIDSFDDLYVISSPVEKGVYYNAVDDIIHISSISELKPYKHTFKGIIVDYKYK